jgi:hypothetical protein
MLYVHQGGSKCHDPLEDHNSINYCFSKNKHFFHILNTEIWTAAGGVETSSAGHFFPSSFLLPWGIICGTNCREFWVVLVVVSLKKEWYILVSVSSRSIIRLPIMESKRYIGLLLLPP